MAKKIKEPEELVRINLLLRNYGGRYANWRSSGCKGDIPLDIIEQLCDISTELDVFLTKYEESK